MNNSIARMREMTVYCVCFCIVFHNVHAAESRPQRLKVAIASAHPLATKAGLQIIDEGGNIFDAAVAVSSTLSVVEPSGSGLGGGGYWLIHRAADGFETMVDAREKAPYAAVESMYRNSHGEPVSKLSLDGPKAAGIPGLPGALAHISLKYGRLPLAKCLAPAIQIAENGFAIGPRLVAMIKERESVLAGFPSSSKIFLANGKTPKKFAILQQKDLALTLRQLAKRGHKGFYNGNIAKKLVSSVRRNGGIWTEKDLSDYRVIERNPVRGNFHGIKVTSVSPSSSGGIVLIEALNILSEYNFEKNSVPDKVHLVTEAMRRAYHDRALFLGDPDYFPVPSERLLDKNYAAGLRSTIRMDKALPSTMLAGEQNPKQDGDNTSHFSIVDSAGNRVAVTQSINFSFGSGFVADGTGVILNDEMDDFVSATGVGNGYGLIGGTANAVQPGKRMLSSMTPTFLENDQGVAVLGTPGGSRIISMVLLATLDFAENHSPDSWVGLPRYHHQYIPDEIQYEPDAFDHEALVALQAKGHHLSALPNKYGNMQAVFWDKTTGQLSAASDPRGEGLAQVFSAP